MYHNKLLLGEIISRSDLSAADTDVVNCWCSDSDVVSAVWTLVDLCSSSPVANEASPLVADFISRVCFQSFIRFHATVCCCAFLSSQLFSFINIHAGWLIQCTSSNIPSANPYSKASCRTT
jgi:hypothetical protein